MGQSLVCPDGFECLVICNGVDACDEAQIQCPAEAACRIQCMNGMDACGTVPITCGAGSCTLECSGDDAACLEVVMDCGAGACTATCDAGATAPTLNCGPSCACAGC